MVNFPTVVKLNPDLLTIGKTSNSFPFARGDKTWSVRIEHCAFITSRKDSRILKWNAGVNIFLLRIGILGLNYSNSCILIVYQRTEKYSIVCARFKAMTKG